MSMHEFEDLVEESVRVLASSKLRAELDLRSIYWWLYDFQNHWDTGFTHFRVMDSLLDARFIYRMEPSQHPDYVALREFFARLTDFAFIRINPLESAATNFFDTVKGWTATNPVAGYFNAPYLYCDAGSPLWARLVEAGVLTGRDAVPPDAQLGLTGAVLAVCRAAEEQGDISLIGAWYGYLALQLASFNDDLDPLLNDPSLSELMTLTQHLKAPNFTRTPEPLMALLKGFAPLIEDVPAYLEQIKEVRRMQSDPNV
jgi:hypothetical protein